MKDKTILHLDIKYLLLPVSIALLIILTGNYSGIINNDDEALYSAIAKEMSLKNEWLLPTLFNEPALYKPPFVYWMMILSYKLFGHSLSAARIPMILTTICTTILIYFLGKELFQRKEGFIASLLFATSFGLMAYGGNGLMDMPLTLAISFSVYCFTMAFRGKSNVWIFAFLCFAGISTLIKGPISAIILLIFAFAACVIFKKMKIFFNIYALAGTALCLFFICLWPLALFIKGYYSQWFNFFVVRENFGKFQDAFHYGHIEFLYYIFQHSFPWLFFIFSGLIILFQKKLFKKEEYVLLLLWALSIISIFLFPATKLKHFLLPVVPAVMLIASAAMENYKENIFTKLAYFSTAGLLILIFILNFALARIISPHVIFYNAAALIFLVLSIYFLFRKNIINSSVSYGAYVCFLMLVLSAFNFQIIPEKAISSFAGEKIYVVEMQVYNFEYKFNKKALQIQNNQDFYEAFNEYNDIIISESDLEKYSRGLNLKPSMYNTKYSWSYWKKDIPFRSIIASLKTGNISPISEKIFIIRKTN